MNKTYEVVIREERIATYTVEAENAEQAEKQAWNEHSDRHYQTIFCDVEYVEEQTNE